MVDQKARATNISVFALLSGAGILLAQIAWNRQLLLITGGSTDATAVVLSAFMLGLGFGGRFFGRKAEQSANPLSVLRLEPGGVAAQWVPLHKLPVEEFTRIIATWSRVFPNVAVHSAGGRHAILIGSVQPLHLDIGAMFRDSIAAEQLISTGFREAETVFLQPLLSDDEVVSIAESEIASNTDDLAPCQFLLRKCQGDPQQTIGENMSLLLSLDTDGEATPVYTGQIVYWNTMLPQAAELFRTETNPTAMGKRWLSVALSTGAELLYNEGRYQDALDLVDMAWEADPGWQRNIDLVIEINRAQSLVQEEI